MLGQKPSSMFASDTMISSYYSDTVDPSCASGTPPTASTTVNLIIVLDVSTAVSASHCMVTLGHVCVGVRACVRACVRVRACSL